VLLAGGTGTRLWPISRELYPKQLASLVGADSLIQDTIKRLFPLLEADKVRVVCGKEHYWEIKRHLEAIGISVDNKIITEPCGRNTAPAILLAALGILKKTQDAILLVLPADHVIRDVTRFQERLKKGIAMARDGYIVTFGIKPNYPETAGWRKLLVFIRQNSSRNPAKREMGWPAIGLQSHNDEVCYSVSWYERAGNPRLHPPCR